MKNVLVCLCLAVMFCLAFASPLCADTHYASVYVTVAKEKDSAPPPAPGVPSVDVSACSPVGACDAAAGEKACKHRVRKAIKAVAGAGKVGVKAVARSVRGGVSVAVRVATPRR